MRWYLKDFTLQVPPPRIMLGRIAFALYLIPHFCKGFKAKNTVQMREHLKDFTLQVPPPRIRFIQGTTPSHAPT